MLSAPLGLAAGATYFLSVSAHCIQPLGEAWLWQDADLVNGYSVSFSYSSGQWLEFQDADSAFELAQIPAPGGVTAGVVGVLLLSRRRR